MQRARLKGSAVSVRTRSILCLQDNITYLCKSVVSVFTSHRAIFTLGISMTFLNVPVEWISLGFEWTWMLLFEDVQQGVFYSTLFCFWIIFCGEHLMVRTFCWSFFLTVLFIFSCKIVLFFLFFSTINPSGSRPEESSLGVLVAGRARGVRLICSPHI